jgi:hypothetical protein
VDSRAIVRLEGLGQLNHSVTISNQTCELPAYNIMPMPLIVNEHFTVFFILYVSELGDQNI